MTSSMIYADKPYNISDPELIERGYFRLDIGGDYTKNNDHKEFVKIPDFGARFGLGLVEIGVHFSGVYINDTESYEDYDRGDLYISTKFSILCERKLLPCISILSEVKVPTAANQRKIGTDETDYFLKFLAMKRFENSRINIEAGLEVLGDPETNQSQNDGFIYGIMGEYNLTNNFRAAAEFYGDFIEGRRNTAFISGILLYKLKNNFEIYAGGRKGLNRKTDDWGCYLGLGYSFDINNLLECSSNFESDLN